MENKDGSKFLDYYGCPRFMLMTNNTELIIKLIDKKADINVQDNEGWTALMCICKTNDNTELRERQQKMARQNFYQKIKQIYIYEIMMKKLL